MDEGRRTIEWSDVWEFKGMSHARMSTSIRWMQDVVRTRMISKKGMGRNETSNKNQY